MAGWLLHFNSWLGLPRFFVAKRPGQVYLEDEAALVACTGVEGVDVAEKQNVCTVQLS